MNRVLTEPQFSLSLKWGVPTTPFEGLVKMCVNAAWWLGSLGRKTG